MAIDVVVADDLTGAADTAAQFLPIADRVLVFPSLRHFKQVVDANQLPNGDIAIGISTESRHVSPNAAAFRVRLAHRLALRLKPRLLFQKVDSALRGNPGAELAAYRASIGAATVLMTPAFPPSGRAVRDGVLFVGGVPLAESEVGRDPRSPASESSVRAVLRRQTDLALTWLPLATIRGDGPTLTAQLRAVGSGIAVADAETPADLAAIARAAIEGGLLHAVSGSAGLAAALGGRLARPSAPISRKLPRIDRRVLAVIGSPHPVARAQVARTGGYVLTLEAARDASLRPQAQRNGIQRVVEALSDDQFAVVCPPPLVDRISTVETAAETAAALASVAASICGAWTPDGERLVQAIVVSGGDVAAALCRRLHADRLELIDQVFPGAPLAVLRGGAANGVPIVTKSGAHGGEDGLLRIVARLQDVVGTVAGRPDVVASGE